MLRAKSLVMKLSAARNAVGSPRAASMALFALLAAMASAPAGSQQFTSVGGREIRLVPARPLDTVVARLTLGELTIADLMDYYRWYRPPIAPAIPYTAVPEMPRPWIAQLSGLIRPSRTTARTSRLPRSAR